MMLALDANTLVRAVLGKRARAILETHSGVVDFLVTGVAVDEARFHLPLVLTRRGFEPGPALAVLDDRRRKVWNVEAAMRKGWLSADALPSPFRCAPGTGQSVEV